jgi:kumamolisin
MAGLLLLGMLLGACTTAGGSSATSTAAGKPGVTPVSNGGSRAVGERPPAIAGLPQGTPLPASLIMPLSFHLVYNDAAMEQALARIYTSGSANYHQFLTPAQIVGRYGESDAQLAVVKRWLSDHGYTMLGSDSLRVSLRVQAPVSSIEASLGIQLESFSISGHRFFLQVGTPTLSGEVAGLVQAVVGLDNFALPIFKPPFGALEHASGQNSCAGYGAKLNLTRDRIAAVYRENALYQQGLMGQGMSIGVAEFDEPYALSDINTYTTCAGLGAAHIQNIQVDGPTAPGPGEGEAALDLELIAGLAPRAQILDYQVGTRHGNIAFAQALVDLFTRVASDRRLQVLSVSYGAGDGAFSQSEQNAVNRALRTLAAEGISVFISSGDCGAFAQRISNIAMVSFPASAPYAIAVGGTHLQITPASTRAREDVWSDNDGAAICQNEWGSGGGVSQNSAFQRPFWQVGPGTTSHYDGAASFVLTASLTPLQAPNGLRQVPDVAAAAYPNISIYYDGLWYAFGGTSAAAPIWAAGALLVDQGLQHHGSAPLGGVPTFYMFANHPGHFHPYTDITQGSNLFYPATRGWDYATGWGAPDLSELLQVALSR